jgi:acyl carrier protein phosphodiesterase
MNFLAHQYLSFESPPVMAGNFMADSIRGALSIHLPDEVLLGIKVHRFIDSFTDTHPVVLESRALLYPYFSKYAGVVQDVFYDHFLALDWKHYHPETLPAFAKKVYSTLVHYEPILNEKAKRTLLYMSKHRWLEGYESADGVNRALSGLATRASFPSNMQNSIPALEANFEALKKAFDVFFPELELAVKGRYAQSIADTFGD